MYASFHYSLFCSDIKSMLFPCLCSLHSVCLAFSLLVGLRWQWGHANTGKKYCCDLSTEEQVKWCMRINTWFTINKMKLFTASQNGFRFDVVWNKIITLMIDNTQITPYCRLMTVHFQNIKPQLSLLHCTFLKFKQYHDWWTICSSNLCIHI